MDAEFILKPYIVSVSRYPDVVYYAASRGRALAKAWGDYRHASDVSFGRFLEISNCKQSREIPKRFGEKIIVGGESAFWVAQNGQYVQFVRPNSDVILNSHPLDVEPPEARCGTSYAPTTESSADEQ